MNTCANCGGRLFIFNETEELYPGSEIIFCSSCRRKVNSFLEDQYFTSSNVDHLNTWKSGLLKAGVTQNGIQALNQYCTYLDKITPRTMQQAQLPTSPVLPLKQEPEVKTVITPQATQPTQPTGPALQVVSIKEVSSQMTLIQREISTVTYKLEQNTRKLKKMLGFTIFSGIFSILAFLLLLYLVFQSFGV